MLDIPYDDVVIKRTKGKKPFVANKTERHSTPNFNFNVSHEGDFVVLSSEPVCLTGIDVSAPTQVRRRGKEQSMAEIKRVFESSFTDREWDAVLSAASEEAQKEVFQQLWSLKEAYVKARGDGIAFELRRAEFEILPGPPPTARLRVDGAPQRGWAFSLHALPRGHWVSVARGPPDQIVDAYGEFTATLKARDVPPDVLQSALHAEAPPFQALELEALCQSTAWPSSHSSGAGEGERSGKCGSADSNRRLAGRCTRLTPKGPWDPARPTRPASLRQPTSKQAVGGEGFRFLQLIPKKAQNRKEISQAPALPPQ
eukprot:CAMPEP_0177591444 /NCGR_PEP_ID=MMETSP0419_2-20121207/8001_1 /TAXON_ID=582737 /ORGANISM="Tetraselmis sp., Strain GSL018" /LENGTH=312 /DNA_ID=CAMNT_0019082187 /DNA_START=463 /DNA_END=1402 /DNA_ORIENTATION=+